MAQITRSLGLDVTEALRQLQRIERQLAEAFVVRLRTEVDDSELERVIDLVDVEYDTKVEIVVDDSALGTVLSAIDGGGTLQVDISVDDGQLSGVLSDVQGGASLDVDIAVDSGAVDALDSVLAGIDGQTLTPSIDIDEGDLSAAESLLNDLGSAGLTPRIDVDEGNLGDVERRLNSLTGLVIDAKVDIGDGNLGEIQTQLSGLGDTITATINVDDSEVEAAQRAIDGLSQTETVDIDVDRSEIDGLEGDLAGERNIDIAANFINSAPQFAAEFSDDFLGALQPRLEGALAACSLGWVLAELSNVDVNFDLEEATREFLVLQDTFEIELPEAIEFTRNAIANDLVADTGEAADLMIASIQRLGPDAFNEASELIAEFSDDFARVGFDGAEAMGLIASATETQLFPTIDRAGDIFQEFAIRVGAGDVVEQLEMIGLSAEGMQEALATGDGERALQEISTALLAVENEAERNRLAMEIFGTAVEEAASPEAVLNWLSQAEAIEGVGGAADGAVDTLNGTIGNRLGGILRDGEELWRRFSIAVFDATFEIGGAVGDFVSMFDFGPIVDAFNGAFESVREALDSVDFEAISANLQAFFDVLVPVVDFLIEIFATVLVDIGEVIAGVVGVVLNLLEGDWAEAWEFFTDTIDNAIGLALTFLGPAAFTRAAGALVRALGNVLGRLAPTLARALAALPGLATRALGRLAIAFGNAIALLPAVLSSGLVAVGTALLSGLGRLPGLAATGAGNIVAAFGAVLGSLADEIGSALGAALTAITGWIGDALSAVGGFAGDFIASIDLSAAASRILEGLATALPVIAGWVGDAVRAIADFAARFVASIDLSAVARRILEGLAAALPAIARWVADAVASAAGFVAQFIGSIDL